MKMLVFDPRDWRRTGDVGDNSQFWKPATLLRSNGDTCTVQWEDGTITEGHFRSAMKPYTGRD